MADPQVLTIPEKVWLKIDSGQITGTLYLVDSSFAYYKTYRDIDATPPDDNILPEDKDNFTGKRIFGNTDIDKLTYDGKVDLYIYCVNADDDSDDSGKLLYFDQEDLSSKTVDVNVQDQTTRPIIVKFNQVQESTELTVLAVKGAYTITVDDTTGFIDGRYIIIFDPASENFSTYVQVGAVAASVVTLDTPLDYAYPVGAFVDTTITNLAVNGSVSPQTFGLRGVGAPPGVDISVDITRIIFKCITVSAVDLTTFGDLVKLTRGLVLRKRDGTIQNIFNIKDNGEIAGIMYDFDVAAATNPQQGVDGFTARLTFGGQSKIGVVVRLPIGEDLELLVQDNLSGLTSLEIVAEGHVVD